MIYVLAEPNMYCLVDMLKHRWLCIGHKFRTLRLFSGSQYVETWMQVKKDDLADPAGSSLLYAEICLTSGFSGLTITCLLNKIIMLTKTLSLTFF